MAAVLLVSTTSTRFTTREGRGAAFQARTPPDRWLGPTLVLGTMEVAVRMDALRPELSMLVESLLLGQVDIMPTAQAAEAATGVAEAGPPAKIWVSTTAAAAAGRAMAAAALPAPGRAQLVSLLLPMLETPRFPQAAPRAAGEQVAVITMVIR